MIRQQQNSVWPFLCILACLFVLSAVSPQVWDRIVDHRLAGVGVGSSVVARDKGDQQTPPDAAGQERQAEVEPLPNDTQWLDPAASFGNSPSAELEMASLELPVAPAPILVQPAPPVANLVAVPERAVTEWRPADALPWREDRTVRAAPAEEPSSAWQPPEALLDRLVELIEDCDTTVWALEVDRALRELTAAVSESTTEPAVLVDRLRVLTEQAEPLARQLGPSPVAISVRRAGHALRRRLLLWEPLVALGGRHLDGAPPTPGDSQRLATCMAEFDAATRHSVDAPQWREFLLWESLVEVTADTPARQDEARQIARKVLTRMESATLEPGQQEFIATGPLAALGTELQRFAAESIDLAALQRRVEQYESDGGPSVARQLAEDRRRLAFSPLAEERLLAKMLEENYRNANARVAVSEQFLNRLIPAQEPMHGIVRDRIQGVPIRGQSLTLTDLSVRLVPDEHRVRLELEAHGKVSASVLSTSGPVTFRNSSNSTYLAVKPLELDLQGFHVEPAEASAQNAVRLRSVRTDYDSVPLVGSLVRAIARNQHEQSRFRARREAEWKLSTKVRQQMDSQARESLAKLAKTVDDRVFVPLEKMALEPMLIEAQTTEQRLVMRLRLAADEQLGSHTPRPREPTGSLVSIQLHESAINNLVERLELDGRTFTLAELRGHVASMLALEESTVSTAHDDVAITFADADAVGIRCRDGRIGITLNVARLRNGAKTWRDFQVRTWYRPETQGITASLVRDGVVQLIGQRLDTRSQIALRGIFCKTFSKNRPVPVIRERAETDPRFAGMQVSQFVIDDGWIALALGLEQIASRPVAARR
ncbi:MAG: hypothetical protein HQ581_25800 [Planctomycetes bacterium]|nr:hypothetical protein [Planctomycetota bacterium]